MKKLFKSLLCLALFATLLCGCTTSNDSKKDFTYADTIVWDAQYDVVVAGFGASGAVSAKTAADEGSKVLIVEKVSEGEAGGNSKFAGQLFAYGKGDYEKTLSYYKALAGDTKYDEEIIKVIAEGVTNMADILANDFGADKSKFMDWTGLPVIGAMSPEYPELPGSDVVGLWTTHAGISDGALYKLLKENVIARSENIDVWFETPAVSLIQDPQSKTIIGVKVERNGKTLNIRALNGVVLATGGFEANAEMVENYLGLTTYSVIGGLHNTGDGLTMAMEVGADLTHMHVYEGAFGLGGLTYKVEEGERSAQIVTLQQNALNTGSLIVVGGSGERYFNESEIVRHGHVGYHEYWDNLKFPSKSFMLFDQKKMDEIGSLIPERFVSQIIKANSMDALASAIGADAATLKDTITNYSSYAKSGKDAQFYREASTMSAFEGSAYYALEVIPAILNTQGGPKRNAEAQVLDVNGSPIPNLYSAGEMGGVTSKMYQGGTNLAECIIMGQIAGKNASTKKTALPKYDLEAVTSNPILPGTETDLGKTEEYETKENEYIGRATGMGGELVVKVTMDGEKIANIEILKHTESEGIADPAINQIPQAIIDAQSTEVDTISSATITSKAIIEAVNNALKEVKK